MEKITDFYSSASDPIFLSKSSYILKACEIHSGAKADWFTLLNRNICDFVDDDDDDDVFVIQLCIESRANGLKDPR